MEFRKDMKEFLKNGYFEKPQFLQIEITDYCPLKCPQCYKKDTDFKYMEKERFQEIILEAKEVGVKSIFLNGGEPLLHKDFIDMVKICNRNGLECCVFTSGIGVTDEFCKEIKNLELIFQISLNGSTKEINSLSRDGYEITLGAMKYLKNSEIDFNINWVARHDNVRDLENLIILAKNFHAKSINIVCNKMTSHGEIIEECNFQDYEILKQVIEDNQDFIKIQSCYGILMAYLGREHGNNRLYGCQAGIRLMAIDVEGKFMPCTHLHYLENYSSILGYWKNSKVLNELRKIHNLEYCNDCNKCRVCHSISKESHDNLKIGYKNCPVKNEF